MATFIILLAFPVTFAFGIYLLVREYRAGSFSLLNALSTLCLGLIALSLWTGWATGTPVSESPMGMWWCIFGFGYLVFSPLLPNGKTDMRRMQDRAEVSLLTILAFDFM